MGIHVAWVVCVVALAGAATWTFLDAQPPAESSLGADQGRLTVPANLQAVPLVPPSERSPQPPPRVDPPQTVTTSSSSSSASSPPPPPSASSSPPPPAGNATLKAQQDQAAARAKFCVTPGWYCRTYTWEFRRGSYWLVLQLDPNLYDTYRAEAKPVRIVAQGGAQVVEPAYDIYVSDPRDDLFVGQVATELRRMATSAGFGPQDEQSFVLAFVQGLPYTSDLVTTGFDEYPRYPVETLVDNGGDCEDTSILYASLLGALGYAPILVSPPRHMAVGVPGSASAGAGLDIGSLHYLFAETTGTGWELGEVPPEVQMTAIQSWYLTPTPLFTLTGSSASGHGSNLDVTTTVTNLGTAAADAQVVATIRADNGTLYSTAVCPVAVLAWHGTQPCALHVDVQSVPQGVSVRLQVRVEHASQVYDVLNTSPFVPWT